MSFPNQKSEAAQGTMAKTKHTKAKTGTMTAKGATPDLAQRCDIMDASLAYRAKSAVEDSRVDWDGWRSFTRPHQDCPPSAKAIQSGANTHAKIPMAKTPRARNSSVFDNGGVSSKMPIGLVNVIAGTTTDMINAKVAIQGSTISSSTIHEGNTNARAASQETHKE